jgi:hypothetical protein
MLDVEITGNEQAVAAAKAGFAEIAGGVRTFRQKGFDGKAVEGLVGKLLPSALPAAFNLLKSIVVKDRDLKITIEGNEFVVRDLPELEKLLDMLIARGLIAGKDLGK